MSANFSVSATESRDPIQVRGESLQVAAKVVVRRLRLLSWSRTLSRTASLIAFLGLVALVSLRLAGLEGLLPFTLGTLFLWIVCCAAWAWWRSPGAFAALAKWDKAAGEGELLASAWWFQKDGATSEGALLHQARALSAIPRRRAGLSTALPFSFRKWPLLLPLLMVVFAASSWLVRPKLHEDLGLSDSAKNRAAEVGKTLVEQVKTLEQIQALSPEEEKKLRGLQTELKQAAGELEKQESPRNLLQDLERRAREAEKLAESLKADDSGALSPGFLSELERSADLADLGNALRSGDLGAAAEQAQLLSARLGSRKPSLEEQRRIEEAIKKSLEAANQKDKGSKTAKRLEEAQKGLGANDSSGAGKSLGQLSQELGAASQRRKAQQRLRDLAQSFRGAGQEILGGQNLQRLAPSPGQMPPGLALNPQSMLPGGQSNQMQGSLTIPIPGSPSSRQGLQIPLPAGDGRKGAGQFPMPGQGAPPSGGAIVPSPGGGSGDAMIFPVPGLGTGDGGEGGEMAQADGADGAGEGSGQGGSQAGNGTAPLGDDTTKPIEAANTASIAPGASAEGPSEVSAVQGDSHMEKAVRSQQELAIDFLKTEEAALADETLPPSRREQVLRYFTAIRQQLEGQK